MRPGKRIRVVLDTNTIISAILGWDSKPAEILVKLGSGELVNCISWEMLSEVKNVLTRPKIMEKTTHYERQYLLDFLESTSIIVSPKEKLSIIPEDPDDDRILECAVEARASYVVSGDKHLLQLGEYLGIRIVNSDEFLRELCKSRK